MERPPVDETVQPALENVTMGDFRGATARRRTMELKHTLNSVKLAIATRDGLGGGPLLLYRLPEYDQIHVRRYFQLALLFS